MYQKLKKVLIAEDADDQRRILQVFFESHGLVTLAAEDGLIATKVLETNAVDLLVTDFRMPNMDGASLLDWCRSRSLDIPVIFLSSEAHLFTHEELALRDCCSLLMKSKPISFTMLEAALLAADRHDREACAFKTFKDSANEIATGRALPGQF